MAVKIRSLSFLALFLYLFLVLVSVAAARKLKARSVLNVRAALAVARGEAEEKRFVAAGGKDETLAALSLPLVHRDSVLRSNNASFEQRMKQRLKRDAARVASINARLEFAVSGLSASDLKPQGTTTEMASLADFQSPVVSGISQGSGEYFTRVGVGSPAKSQLVVLDTGSDIVWIQCQPCSDCYTQSDPIFNPAVSSTYNGLQCGASQCQELDVSGCSRSGACIYQVNYGDGSYTIGSFATETITLGKTPVQNVAIGCGHDNEGLFVGAAGLLGLGGGALSFPSQLPQSDAKIFSYCLVDRDSSSSSTLQFGREAVPRGAVFAPLLKNSRMDTFYYVSLSGISVGGNMLSIPQSVFQLDTSGISVGGNMLSIPQSVFQLDTSGNGGVIVDSGTAVTRLQTQAYDAMRDAFVAGTKDLPSTAGVSLFDTCYDLSNKDTVSVPTIAFHFPNGGSLSLPAKNYLVPVDSTGTFCFAFAPVSSSLSIIGNIQQQGIRVSYDPGNSQVGFAVNKC